MMKYDQRVYRALGLSKQAALNPKVASGLTNVAKWLGRKLDKPAGTLISIGGVGAGVAGAWQIPGVKEAYRKHVVSPFIDPLGNKLGETIHQTGGQLTKVMQEAGNHTGKIAEQTAKNTDRMLKSVSDTASSATRAIGAGIGSGLAFGARRLVGAAAGAGLGGIVTDLILDKYLKGKENRRKRLLLTILGSAAGGGLGYWASTLMDGAPYKSESIAKPSGAPAAETSDKPKASAKSEAKSTSNATAAKGQDKSADKPAEPAPKATQSNNEAPAQKGAKEVPTRQEAVQDADPAPATTPSSAGNDDAIRILLNN